MPNSERQLKQSTQVAYLECLEKGEKILVLEGKTGPFTIKSLILATIDINEVRLHMEADGFNFDNVTIQTMIKYSDLDEGDKQIISQFEDEVLMWKIVDIHNMTTENGFYGCVIQTSDDNVIVGFRGSEGISNYAGLIYDWVESDFGLLNNADTIQTVETDYYALNLSRKRVLDKYKTIDVAGHSLGGNLASHFAVACASNKECETVFSKINNVCNFDGPGVSNEYIKKYKDGIESSANKITHYKWSPIGSLLYNVPGEKEVFLKTRKYYGEGGFKDKIGYYTFGKHDTRSIIFDESGKAIRGKEGLLAKKLKKVSLELEQHPDFTNSVYSLAASTIGKLIYQKDNGQIGFKLPFINSAPDDYRSEQCNYENPKIKCEYFVNCVVKQVIDYTFEFYNGEQILEVDKINNII